MTTCPGLTFELILLQGCYHRGTDGMYVVPMGVCVLGKYAEKPMFGRLGVTWCFSEAGQAMAQ